MTLADQKATIARTSEAFVDADLSAETVTRAAREVLNDSAERGGGVQMLNVDKIYPGATNKALDNFNLEINPGEMVVLLGGSGRSDSRRRARCDRCARQQAKHGHGVPGLLAVPAHDRSAERGIRLGDPRHGQDGTT